MSLSPIHHSVPGPLAPRAPPIRSPLAPLVDPDYLPHILESVFTYLPDPSLATCLRVSKHFQCLAAPHLYSHLVLSTAEAPFKGLDVYNPETRERKGSLSPTKMELLRYTRIIDLRGHEDDICKRYSAAGWILPKFQVLRLYRPLLPKRDRPTSMSALVTSINSREAKEKHPHPRTCKIMSDLSPSTLVVMDLDLPTGRTGHPIGLGNLPPTIQKLVLLSDASTTRIPAHVGSSVYQALPIDTSHIVCLFKKCTSPVSISRLVNSMADLILWDPDKSYTIVNVEALSLVEMAEMEGDAKLQRFKTPMRQCMEHYMQDRKKVDEILDKIEYLSLEEYLRKGGSKEFTPEEIEQMRTP